MSALRPSPVCIWTKGLSRLGRFTKRQDAFPKIVLGAIMIRIAYLSTAVRPPSPEELEGIVRVAHKNNANRHVSGLLCYHDGSFLQFLEGPQDAVEWLYAQISADPRHHSLLTLYRTPITQRLFADWTMAVVRPQEISAEQRRFCQGLREVEVAASQEGAGAVTPFLTAFRAWLR
jgi:hypothetical protein